MSIYNESTYEIVNLKIERGYCVAKIIETRKEINARWFRKPTEKVSTITYNIVSSERVKIGETCKYKSCTTGGIVPISLARRVDIQCQMKLLNLNVDEIMKD